jgi:hypothetical protein
VVPVGGLEITGVFVVLFLLHAANNISTQTHTIASKFFLLVITDRCLLIRFLRHWLAGHTILALDPFAEVYKLAAFRTEGTDRIVFPLDWLTAGWTLHES